jgi:16S rRNA (guanine527-N7)-methyltransferase
MNPTQEDRLRDVMHVFLEENTKLNLSALRTEDACWHGNILDSVPFMELIEQKIIDTPKNLIDIGTGGGFPLLPLSVLLPDTKCTGLDSTAKKIEAIKRIVAMLNMKNVALIAERSEILGRNPAHRDAYDVVTARAVAPLATLLEYTSPFAKAGGHIVLWKSLQIEEELKMSAAAQKALFCPLIYKHEYDLGGDWGRRQLLVFKKEQPTPRMYPRELGMPKKTPIE